ncbi:MAG: hypothetical protein AB199_01815 [Parcubacteria bacterium C7867-004]|nr:MAG: hypothetical protein AB199_01815 [Parcubacteria bacterium C7867-004]
MLGTLRTVFKEARSTSIAIAAMLVLFAIVAFFPNLGVLGPVFASAAPVGEKAAFLFSLLGSPAENATGFGFALLLISVFLSGLVIALAAFALRKRAQDVSAMGVSGLGMLSAFVGIGCASCGSLVLSALIPIIGAGAFATLLPLGGLEFSILGILLLLISGYVLVRKIERSGVCAIA